MKRRSGVTGGDIKGVSPICKCLFEFCEKRLRKASGFQRRRLTHEDESGLLMLTLFGNSCARRWTQSRWEVI